MNVFGIGLPEMAIIFIVALLVFGPKKLPEIGRSVGKALRSFQDATKEFETEFKQEVEKVERVVKEPMTATIEPPEPKALDSANVTSATSEDDSLSTEEMVKDEEKVENEKTSVTSAPTGSASTGEAAG